MFQASYPVTDDGFFDRIAELGRLFEVADRLEAGAPEWLAIIGPRKIGKTSMLLELSRRRRSRELVFVVFDVLEGSPVTTEVLRTYAVRCLDAALGEEIGVSLEHMLDRPQELVGALSSADRFAKLPAALRRSLVDLPSSKLGPATLRLCLDLPEQLAAALGVRFLVAIDEFQELATIPRTRSDDLLPLMRSVWQKHRRVGYVVSGSARAMLTELVTAERSPFFQHFALMNVGPFQEERAVEMLIANSPPSHKIPKALAVRAYAAIGGHPFYLQLLGDALVRHAPHDEISLKVAIQELLFSRVGRLALYFQAEYQRLVGRAAGLAATLDAVASGPKRAAEISKAIGAASGTMAHYLERLGDAVTHGEDGMWSVTDPTFALWLRWRMPGGTVVPMSVVGDEAERAVAAHLARSGFDLVYQSRASRGAFDLLATRGADHLGVQVKRSPLPLRFSRREWNRMVADAKRLGWRWVIASVSKAGEIELMDPSRAKRGKQIRVDDAARIDNILIFAGPASPE